MNRVQWLHVRPQYHIPRPTTINTATTTAIITSPQGPQTRSTCLPRFSPLVSFKKEQSVAMHTDNQLQARQIIAIDSHLSRENVTASYSVQNDQCMPHVTPTPLLMTSKTRKQNMLLRHTSHVLHHVICMNFSPSLYMSLISHLPPLL